MSSKSKCLVSLGSGWKESGKVGIGDSGTLGQKAHFVKALGNGSVKYSGAIEGWNISCNKMTVLGERVHLHRLALTPTPHDLVVVLRVCFCQVHELSTELAVLSPWFP